MDVHVYIRIRECIHTLISTLPPLSTPIEVMSGTPAISEVDSNIETRK